MLTGDMLRRSAERFPAKPAILFGDRTIRYEELDAASHRFANALREAGFGIGAKVALLSRNLPEYGIVFFGCARSGCVLVNVSIQYSEEELAWVLDKADAELLIVDVQLAERARAARTRCPKLRRMVSIGVDPTGEATGFDTFIGGAPDGPPPITLDERQPFCMTYTGGTTGRPKGVLFSHRGRAVTAHTVALEEALDERDVVAIVTPLFHVAALNIMFQPAILVGATCVFVTPWSVAGFQQACRQHRVTAAFMVPTQANMLVSSPEFDAASLTSWRKLSFAGAPMPDWVQRELKAKLPHLLLTQIYGQSEMGVLTSLRDWYLPQKLGSIGRQAFNVDVELFNLRGEPAAVGEPGEIASRGDNVMLEYYREPEQTAAVFRLGGGWALTGDVGVRDAEGFITLIDRAKDMLISGGENIYPKEIEDVIYRLDEVAECAVFGIPDPKWGEVPAAYLTLKPGATLTEETVISHCRGALAEFKRPRVVRVVRDFPKTPIGKIQKNLLREPWWRDQTKKI